LTTRIRGRWPHDPLCLSTVEGLSKIRVGDEFRLQNNYDLLHRFFFTFRIQLPWRFAVVTLSFTSGVDFIPQSFPESDCAERMEIPLRVFYLMAHGPGSPDDDPGVF
jgi:hypothetical protein